jgi:site-specific DNA recombinase
MLRNRYYVGKVRFDGVEYEGRHQPLVTEQLFEECQRTRKARTQSREKPACIPTT